MSLTAFIAMCCLFVIFGICLTIQSVRISTLKRKNESQRMMLEAEFKPEPKKKPGRIEVYAFDGTRRFIYGCTIAYPEDGSLRIKDSDGLLCAAFAKGGWMSAVVVEEKQKEKKVDDKQSDAGELVHVSRSDAGAAEAVRGDQGGGAEVRGSDSGEHAAERGSDSSGAKDS